MADRQATIDRLLQRLPGYTGYAAKEQRRNADKALRMHLARQFRAEHQALTRLMQDFTASARLAVVERLGKVSQALLLFIAQLETAPRGYASWFDRVQLDEADLEQHYTLDAKLAESLPLLREQLAFVQSQGSEGTDLQEALASLHQFVDNLNQQFVARQAFLQRGTRPD
jgi:hypothetical protein